MLHLTVMVKYSAIYAVLDSEAARQLLLSKAHGRVDSQER